MAQLVVFAFQLYLRRIYSSEDFGAFAIYMSVVGITVSITSLKYEQTIVLPKSNKEGWLLTKLSIFISIIIISFFSFILFFCADWFMQLIGMPPAYKQWLIFLPLSIFLFSSGLALNYFLIRVKNFKVSGSNKVIRRLGEGIVQSSSSFLGKGFGLVLGDVIGQLIIFVRTLLIVDKNSILSENSELLLKDLAIRYKSFPIKNTLPTLLNAFSRLLPIILISRFFTAEIVGYFDLARIMLIIPLSMITVSLNQVLVQRFSEKRNKNQSIKKEATGVFSLLLLGSTVFIILVKLFGTSVFELLFGSGWASSGTYAEILIWAFAFKFLISPFNACFIAFERIGIGSLWQIFYFLLIISLFFIPHSNIVDFLQIYMGVEVLAFMTAGIINFIILRTYERNINIEPN